ncbi:MAG: serine protein kinase PrkA, partial [Bacteroidia bacterium]|nr:serine protein kinase PrkA [Bacteroidia bacterium]
NPFFADRLFINRFIKLTQGFKKGVQNNNIFLFEGPPGSGKSTFLNNLMQKFEEYTKNPEGACYEVYWRLDVKKLGGFQRVERVLKQVTLDADEEDDNGDQMENYTPFRLDFESLPQEYVEFSCPNHDHPILLVPKNYRRQFLDDLLPETPFKQQLFNEKEYEWVFKEIPCTICNSMYTHLLDSLGDPIEAMQMLWARKAIFNRQFGEGYQCSTPVTHYKGYITSPTIQSMINGLLKTDKVAYIHSNLARTNNGILALMDIKEHNVKRLMKLHGIISDGVHKVGLIEERIKSLFVGLVNPADKSHYENIPSFKDRIITVNVPYVLDYKTEVRIYKNKFGENVGSYFLPQVLENVAKIIVSSRLSEDSPAIQKWIKNPDKYYKYLDENYLLLKMEIYAGNTPNWLSDEDLKRLDSKTMKKILAEAEEEGNVGFSGRQSLNIFNDLFTKYGKSDKLITMDMVSSFFSKRPYLDDEIPEGFVESIKDMYDFNVLQEVKESIYSYNRDHISRDIQNYLFAINYEVGDTKVSHYTGDTIEITDDYLKKFEVIFLGTDCTRRERRAFRNDVLAEYISITLAQDMRINDKAITDTEQYRKLFDKYTHNLKENALVVYLDNDNFRRAINDYGSTSFNKYDKRLKQDVNTLIHNLQEKFHYTEEGARQVSIYVLDKDLARKY